MNSRPKLLEVTTEALLDGRHVLTEHVELVDGVHYLHCEQIRLTKAVSGAILISLCDRFGKELVAWGEPWIAGTDILVINNIKVSMTLEIE